MLQTFCIKAYQHRQAEEHFFRKHIFLISALPIQNFYFGLIFEILDMQWIQELSSNLHIYSLFCIKEKIILDIM